MSLISNLIDKLSELLKVKFDQFKLEAQSQLAAVLAKLIVFFGLAILLLFFALFIGFGFAFYLNDLWESSYLGFLTVSVIPLVMFIILLVVSKSQAFTLALEQAILEKEEDEKTV